MLGGLFGRQRRPKAKLDGVFALLTAMPDLEVQGLTAQGSLGLCVRVSEEPTFDTAVEETEETARLYAREHPVTVATAKDGMGFVWFTAAATAFEDAVTAAHLVADELSQRGYADRLLALVVPCDERGHGRWYLVYSYRRGTYYPFCPTAGHDRDNAREMRLSTALPRGLPKEQQLEFWYPLWDPPLPPS